MTLEEAVQAQTSSVTTTAERLARLKAILDATESAMFAAAAGGGKRRYKINSGQSITEVEYQNLGELRRQYRDLLAVYNELSGIASGGNVMVLRNAASMVR